MVDRYAGERHAQPPKTLLLHIEHPAEVAAVNGGRFCIGFASTCINLRRLQFVFV